MYLATSARAAIDARIPISDSEGPIDPDRIRAHHHALCDFLLESVPRGEPVGIHLGKEPRHLLAVCAALETGTPFVPLSPSWPADRIAQVKAVTSCRVIIDASNIETILARPRRELPPRPAPRPTDVAYIMCTSGTTGRPKAVVISRGAYENFVRWVDGYFTDIGPDDRVLFTTEFTFDVSLMNVALFLARRGSHHVSRFTHDVFALASEIERHAITTMITVPNTMSSLLMTAVTKRFRLDSLRHLLVGGSRFSYGVYEAIRATLPTARCYNVYGPTEATVYSHCKVITDDPTVDLVDFNVSIGTPILNSTCVIVDTAGTEIRAAHAPGELLLAGPQVMAGYLGDPDATAAAITVRDGERYYRTGDLGFRDARGNYFVVGRIDETLKRRGFRVNLLDIDSYIQRLDSVRECMTIAVPHPVHEHVLVTYVVAATEVTSDELIENLRTVLVDFQLPDEVLFVSELPRGSTGKVDRKQLEARYRTEEK